MTACLRCVSRPDLDLAIARGFLGVDMDRRILLISSVGCPHPHIENATRTKVLPQGTAEEGTHHPFVGVGMAQAKSAVLRTARWLKAVVE